MCSVNFRDNFWYVKIYQQNDAFVEKKKVRLFFFCAKMREINIRDA